MRATVSMICLLAVLSFAIPAQAQLRGDVQGLRAPAKLYDQGDATFALNKLFSPEHFRMQHSYEMSFGSFGGNSSSLGMYTNTMMWQFNNKLAARVDVSFAHSPFSGDDAFGSQFDQGGRVFLRNAEIAYRPTENTQFHFSIQQSPYGSYWGPYGARNAFYSPYGYGYGRADFGYRHEDMFWNERLR